MCGRTDMLTAGVLLPLSHSAHNALTHTTRNALAIPRWACQRLAWRCQSQWRPTSPLQTPNTPHKSQMDLPAIGMALSEPVGGGLFTSNIVFGAVVLLSTRSHRVRVQPAFIMKDLAFYLFALVWILVAISDSKVGMSVVGNARVGVVYAVAVGLQPEGTQHSTYSLSCATVFRQQGGVLIWVRCALHCCTLPAVALGQLFATGGKCTTISNAHTHCRLSGMRRPCWRCLMWRTLAPPGGSRAQTRRCSWARRTTRCPLMSCSVSCLAVCCDTECFAHHRV